MREFSILEAIAKMAEVSIAIEVETHHALEAAAKLVEKEAKAELGTYQNQAGPFVGWPELADRTKNDRVKAGYTENDPGLASGEMHDSVGRVVNSDMSFGVHEASVGSDNDKAVWFELGTVRQPPRSFLGAAAVRKEAEVVEILGEATVIGLVGAGVFRGRMNTRG